MFIIDSPDLTEVLPSFGGMLSLFLDADFPANSLPIGFDPSEFDGLQTIQQQAVVSGNTATFTAPPTLDRIDLLSANGRAYAYAIAPDSPQPGEFTFDTTTGVVTVFGSFPPGVRFDVSSAAIAATNPPVITSQLPDIFQRFELTGLVEWGLNFEDQPSASFNLICSWADLEAIKAEFQPKKRKQFSLFGIGLEVDSISINKQGLLAAPDRTAFVSVQLAGKWSSYLDQQVILDAPIAGTPAGGRTIRGDTTVQAIAQKVGANASLPPNIVYAPREANQEKAIALDEVFVGHLRPNRMFADYNSNGQMEGRSLNAVPIHTIMLSDLVSKELQISVNAHPRAVDYENSPLEWGNAIGADAAKKEDVQGESERSRPNWRQKPLKREIVTTGDASLDAPVGSVAIKNVLSLNFDNGGPTREQKTVTTEGGVPILQETEKWGFAGTSHQHVYQYDYAKNKWTAGNFASLPWVAIERTTTTYSYDSDTGYLMGVETQGWRLARLRTESSNEGCQAFSAWYLASAKTKDVKHQLLATYEYKQIPVYESTVYNATKLRNHYNDIPPAPREDWTFEEPKFLPNGELNPARFNSGEGVSIEEFTKDGAPWLRIKQNVLTPGWTDPRYCDRELTAKSAFLSAPNPESTEKKPLPDFVTGEAKEIVKGVHVPDYRDRPRPPAKGATGVIVTNAIEEAETFIQADKISNQLDAGFARSGKDKTQTQNKGRPSEHTRKTPLFEKIDPNAETDPRDGNDPDKDEFQHRITTRQPSDPLYIGDPRIVGDSISFPYANSFEQAIAALETDMMIQNFQGTESLDIEVGWSVGGGINAGDRVNLEEHGIWRVLSASKNIAIVAPGLVQPGDVSLSLGKEIALPAIAVERVPIAKTSQGEAGESPESTANRKIADPSQLIKGRSLGNPQGI